MVSWVIRQLCLLLASARIPVDWLALCIDTPSVFSRRDVWFPVTLGDAVCFYDGRLAVWMYRDIAADRK